MNSALPLSIAAGPILVTGAGGFVGGHVARALAWAGYSVRGWTRRDPLTEPSDPPIDWFVGDLRDPQARAKAVEGMRGVVHAAGWVSLQNDPRRESRAVNVEATEGLLEASRNAAVEVFLFTSTLWTVGAGTDECPADEDSPWNLESLRSPYCDTKREAEALVLAANGKDFRTAVLCPGLVIGPRDTRPTSTRLLLSMARWPVIVLPQGGIPVVDAHVVAQAHVRALAHARPGCRYVLAGPYLSYRELAGLVARVARRPWRIVTVPDVLERPMARAAGWLDGWGGGLMGEKSAAAIAGGFLRLRVSGTRADTAFGLRHPDPLTSIHEALAYARRIGLAPWLKLRYPVPPSTLGQPA